MKSEDEEVAKRATQLAGYANDYHLMLKKILIDNMIFLEIKYL